MFRLKKPTELRVGTVSLRSMNLSPSPKSKIVDEIDDIDEKEDDMILEKLDGPIQEDVVPGAGVPQETTGDHAIENFYTHYKKLDKISDINEFKNSKQTMFSSMLKSTEDLKLFPSKIGLVKFKGSVEALKINNFRLGDKYASVLSEGLKTSTNISQLELANNRLTPAGADAILSKVQSKPQVIDLSGNCIGKIGIEHICNLLIQRGSKLMEVNIENNKLGDYAIAELCEAICDNESIRKLNISKNFMTNKAAGDVSKMIKGNNSLQELYIRWNQIKGQGGEAIFDAMKENDHIRVLDLSWNSLGLGASNFVNSFGEFVVKDKTLVHLDLSNNYFGKKDALAISASLEKNHTIYGFHFQGNVGYVDAKGFLVITDEGKEESIVDNVQLSINGVKVLPETLKRYHNYVGEFKNVCWICEGWRPVEFKWKPGASGKTDKDPIHCHLSYETFKGRYLPKTKDFTLPRMVPPVGFGYIYTLDDKQPTCADNQPSKPFVGTSIRVSVGKYVKKYKPEFTNWMAKSTQQQVLGDDYDPVHRVAELHLAPRTPEVEYVAPENVVIRPDWKYQYSAFRDYRPENQALLDRCFEVDWENTRIPKIVKGLDDQRNIRMLLYAIYKQIKDCYKYFAAIGAPSEIWSIPLNTFTEFGLSAGIIDGKLMKLSDFDRIFIATYTRTDKERNPRNPDRAVVRYQFMEGLVRMCDQKYLGNGVANSFTEAMKLLLDESVRPFVSKFDHSKWRNDRLWNEEADCVIKSYYPILFGAYKKYSGQKTKPGQKKFTSLEEFNRLMGDMQLLNDNFGERDSTLYFSLAMMTQVDELESDRIYQMQLTEFIEAVSRAADKFAAAPFGKTEAEMSYEQRNQQPLYLKLEGIMRRLYDVCGPETRDVWVMPETSIFDMPEVQGKQKINGKKRKIVRVDPTDPGSMDVYNLGS